MQDRRDHVAMREHRALGQTGGPACVLQKGQILATHRGGLIAHRFAGRHRIGKSASTRQIEGRHHLAHIADRKIDDPAANRTEHLADRGQHHMPDGGVADHLLQGVREIFENDDRLSSRILELMLELARCVERIDADRSASSPQHTGCSHRKLQDIRQHDCHPLALSQTLRLQPGGKGLRSLVEFAIGHGLVHAQIGGAGAVLLKALVDQGIERRIERRVDISRHTFGIGTEPKAIHSTSSRALGRSVNCMTRHGGADG